MYLFICMSVLSAFCELVLFILVALCINFAAHIFYSINCAVLTLSLILTLGPTVTLTLALSLTLTLNHYEFINCAIYICSHLQNAPNIGFSKQYRVLSDIQPSACS